MALRNRLTDEQAVFPDPVLGVNLRKTDEDLLPGEAKLMKNCYFEHGTETRPGSTRLTETSIAASLPVRGGTKYYYGTNSSKRLIAYGTKISVIEDTGNEVVLTSGQTSDRDTHFTTWSMTDKVYVTNKTDSIKEYDGSTFQAVNELDGANNVPDGALLVKPVLDRLMCITAEGLIERTNPRVAHQWSQDSSWATFRPQLGGPFTALHPHTLRSTQGDLFPGLVATQANALYLITGTNYGDDITDATPPEGLDAGIKLIDPGIGTSSPYALCTVPGIGLFGVSSDLNVWWLPFGEASPRIIGDKIRSRGSVPGLESANIAAIDQIWMAYFDRKLWIGYPTGANAYCSEYFWLDMRSFVEHPDRGPVWFGPHSGFTVNRCWPETQFTDNTLMAGEGNAATGAYVYRMYQSGTETDAVGGLDVDIEYDYWTFYNGYGTPSKEKYLAGLQVDASCFQISPTVSLYDLTQTLASGLSLEEI